MVSGSSAARDYFPQARKLDCARRQSSGNRNARASKIIRWPKLPPRAASPTRAAVKLPIYEKVSGKHALHRHGVRALFMKVVSTLCERGRRVKTGPGKWRIEGNSLNKKISVPW